MIQKTHHTQGPEEMCLLPDAGHFIVVPLASIPSLVAFCLVLACFFVNGAKYLAGNQPPGNAEFTSLWFAFLSCFVGRPASFVPCVSGLNLGVFHFWGLFLPVMAAVLQCLRTLAVHFPSEIYRSTGSSQVLPELVKSLDLPNVCAVQFMPNGVVRVTYKEPAQCDAALASGISFRGALLRVAPVDSRTRLVYVGDLPVEVPDDGLKVYLCAFGAVHSCVMQTYPSLPQVATGMRVVKVSLAKDLPSSARVSGFDVRFWYQGQPQACPVCRSYGHRVKDCPFNGLCHRCSQPGHMARECSFRRSSVSTPAASSVPDVSVSGPVAGVDPAMSEDEDDPDFVCSSASEPGDCSGDEEVVRGASLVELASRMRKRALSETFVDVSAVIESGDLSYLSQSSLGGSQPSLSSAAEPSDPAVSEPSVPVVPESDPVPRSLPPPQKKKRFVDLPPSGFSSEQVADALNRPYSGILPRTSYAHVCPDAVKPDVPVVMDFGYLTRSVLADYCTFELDRFVKYVHRKFTKVVASPVFVSSVAVSVESLPTGTPAKFPGQ